jgi:hypothetical protein
MKRIITSAGLVAVSATGMQAAYAPGLTQMESSKLLSYSVSVRGFYDDNIATTPSSAGNIKDSFGFDVRPSVSLNLTSLQQTFVGATYTYGMRYFADRQPHRADHSHEFDARMEHAFTDRYKINFDDSFVYAQEPEVVGDLGILQRSDFSAYRNTASIGFSGQLTELFGIGLGYDNSWYDYTQKGIASRAALLNRFEHAVKFDTRWVLDPQLTLRVGYRFTAVDFTGNEEILPGSGLLGKVRNNIGHTMFTGVDYSLSSRFKASLDGGVRITTFDNAVAGKDITSPFVSANLTYVYKEGSYAQVGVSVDRTATDLIGTSAAAITSDAESISPYISVSHKITPRLTGTALVRYNNYSYNGGTVNGLGERFLVAQLGADYKLSEHWYLTSTYNYDKLNSDAGLNGRAFTRNRVFLGVTAKY